jgi:hypothetical protein
MSFFLCLQVFDQVKFSKYHFTMEKIAEGQTHEIFNDKSLDQMTPIGDLLTAKYRRSIFFPANNIEFYFTHFTITKNICSGVLLIQR